MNILLTSAGRRTYLVRYFKEAQTDGSLVFAANSTMSPALMEADGHVLTPLIYEEGYVDFLESKIHCPITLVSTGPKRHEITHRKSLL